MLSFMCRVSNMIGRLGVGEVGGAKDVIKCC